MVTLYTTPYTHNKIESDPKTYAACFIMSEPAACLPSLTYSSGNLSADNMRSRDQLYFQDFFNIMDIEVYVLNSVPTFFNTLMGGPVALLGFKLHNFSLSINMSSKLVTNS